MRTMARLGVGRITTAMMLLLMPAAAHAVPITYQFSGTTTPIDGPDGGANVPGGTPFSGTFTYDSRLPLIDLSRLGPGDPATKNYGYFDPTHAGPIDALNAQVKFGRLMSFATPDPSMRSVVVENDQMGRPTPYDSFSVNVNDLNTSHWFELYLRDSTGRALTSTALPLTLDLAKFGEATVEYESDDGLVAGNITSLEAMSVPEPSVLALLALGGLALVIARRKAATGDASIMA